MRYDSFRVRKKYSKKNFFINYSRWKMVCFVERLKMEREEKVAFWKKHREKNKR